MYMAFRLRQSLVFYALLSDFGCLQLCLVYYSYLNLNELFYIPLVEVAYHNG